MIQASGLLVRGSQLPFIIFGALGFFAVPVVAYFGKKLNYSRTEYRFFSIRSWRSGSAMFPQAASACVMSTIPTKCSRR